MKLRSRRPARGFASKRVTAAAASRAERRVERQRGQVTVAFALFLPVLFGLGAIVITVGNWYTHARHLQTKADAAAFAGGTAWGFPCGAAGGDIDQKIESLARTYLGPHMQADGAPYAGTTFNAQVGGVPGSAIHAVLNGTDWYDDDSNPFPADKTSPANPSICDSKVLDVKATEDNSFPLFGVLPFFPDIKRKARVEIQEIAGLTGLLPIAVRLPQPLSAAVAFYDESDGSVLETKPLREVCTPAVPACLFGAPPGLGQWTSEPLGSGGALAQFVVAPTTGVVLATSFRPACGAGTPPAGPPCLDPNVARWRGGPIDDFCHQASGAVQCYDADGSGTTQTVRSGVHFIRGYPPGGVTTEPPEPRSAYLANVDCPDVQYATGYFNSLPNACHVQLNVAVDLGSVLEDVPPTPPDVPVETRLASNVEVRYRQVRADGTIVCDFGPSCALQTASAGGGVVTFSTQGSASSPHLQIAPGSRGNAVALEIRLKGSSVTPADPDCGPAQSFSDRCRWFYTGDGNFGPDVAPTPAQILASPIQRSFMGDLDRTGPLKWLRLTVDQDCNPATFDRIIGTNPVTGDDAASQTAQEHCYFLDAGLAGGLARDQDEPPIALNLGSGSSQRALIDCDPIIPNLKDEIAGGCQNPAYAANTFDTSPLCPGTAGFFDVPKPSPFSTWPPFRCVLTQTTAAANQVVQGFNQRLFGVTNNPRCPGDDVTRLVPGRNYWHRDNNDYDDETFAWNGDTPNDPADDWGNQLSSNDPRLVTLFFSTYDSFTGPGNEVYPIVAFGNFYITGYGRTSNGGWQGGAPDDPCDDGNSMDSDPYNGNGNVPPPDIDFSRNTTWAWGHFVKDVTPAPFTTGGSGILCNPEASFQPCVAVLVE